MPKILSVEDDPDFQRLISLALQNAGYEVHYAFTGQEGYEKVLSLAPDLVLLDMMLPLMSGIEVIKLLKQHKTAKAIPIIVMTAYSTDVNFVESAIKTMDVVEYLRKPVDVGALLRLIGRLIKPNGHRTPPGLSLKKGAVRLDPKFRTVWIDDKLAATLPGKRFEVLYYLAQSKGDVPWEDLVKKIWGAEGTKNDIEKAVQRVRVDLGAGESFRVRTTSKGYELIG